MKFKRSISIVLLALMVSMFGIVSADDDAPPLTQSGVGVNSPALQAAAGLDADALLLALRDGATPAELIDANGGDVAATVAAMIAEAKAALEERMDQRQTEISETLSEWLNGDRRRRGKHRPPQISAERLLNATGLDEATLRQSLNDGATLAGLIEANGGDVAAFVAESVAAVMAPSEDEKAEREAALGERVAGWVNGEPGGIRTRVMFAGTAVNQALMEATGLDPDGLRAALENGESIEALIEANGGDVDEILSQIAEHAIESAERSHAMFRDMREHMDEFFEAGRRRFLGPRFPRMWMPRLIFG